MIEDTGIFGTRVHPLSFYIRLRLGTDALDFKARGPLQRAIESTPLG
jgi:hypothetical protein